MICGTQRAVTVAATVQQGRLDRGASCLQQAAAVIYDLESALVKKHVEGVKFHEQIHAALTETAQAVGKLQVFASTKRDFLDGIADPVLCTKFHEVVRELVQYEVPPFVAVAASATPTEIIRAQVSSGLLFMQQVQSGACDAVSSIDYLRLTEGGFQIATVDVDCKDVAEIRSALMRCLADSLMVVCQWPLALRLLTCSQDSQKTLIKHRNAHTAFLSACPSERMDYTLIKKAGAVRAQCLLLHP